MRHSLSYVKSLNYIAVHFGQHVEFLQTLNALGHNNEIETMRQGDNRLNQASTPVAFTHIVNK